MFRKLGPGAPVFQMRDVETTTAAVISLDTVLRFDEPEDCIHRLLAAHRPLEFNLPDELRLVFVDTNAGRKAFNSRWQTVFHEEVECFMEALPSRWSAERRVRLRKNNIIAKWIAALTR